jgi:HTH-type transcriptional regulator/antitoxin HigA
VDGTDPFGASDDPAERAADELARDWLIPRAAYAEFVATRDFTGPTVRAFAGAQQVAPGIVVGLLERDDLVPPGRLRSLKKRIAFPSPRP